MPPAAQRELRDVVRYRKRSIENRTREANRLQKVLETANVKLGSIASEILGVSARAMLNSGGRRDVSLLSISGPCPSPIARH